jgi:DNA topoisomerase-2
MNISNGINLYGGSNESDFLKTTYKKLSHKEHIKQLTDTYIGSTQTRDEEMFILNIDTNNIEYKAISYNPGLYKIFDEIIVNAYDQYIRLSINQHKIPIDQLIKVSKIKVNIISKKTKTVISVLNNGNGIPIAKHPDHDQWIPELLFGELLTSTNYDFEADKITGGKNGYGAKLTNIFSKRFSIVTVDHVKGKKYTQHFNNNMEKKDAPEIIDYSGEPYTEFTFEPDLSAFKLKEISKDMVGLMARRAYDIAGCTGKEVSVYYNNKKIPVRDFYQYIKLYSNLTIDKSIDSVSSDTSSQKEVENRIVYQKFSDRWEVGVLFDPKGSNQQYQISFVNGVYTKNGGTHVNYILNQIVKEYTIFLHKKYKEELGSAQVKPQYIKEHIWLFLRSTISNPAFDSQTKETLTNTPTNFGSTCNITPDFIKKLDATGLSNKIIETVNFKENAQLAKKDKQGLKNVLRINKLDDANKAGTNESHKCVLILTEGDSAKALAISGLSVIGRDYYGVFPLRGKPLNVREYNLKKINDNEEISNIKKIIGLEHGKKYNSIENSGLRYGKILIMTDQDVDGSHIKGLLFNLMERLWPELIQKHDFITSLLTPVIKAMYKDQVHSFYNVQEYNKWKFAMSLDEFKKWTVKYYKGLGTNTSKEAREYFSKIDTNIVTYKWSDKSASSLILAFDKAYADKRKEWLSHINNPEHEPIKQTTQMTITYDDFINRELIYFSNYDNTRSIPSLVDGLKPAQRKILYAGFKKNLSSGTEIKVAQFVGYVSEHTSYHHGEASLSGAIIAMAQNFLGSNNINLLHPSGQFGTRLQGGKDAASPRYIFTEFSYYLQDKSKKKNYLTPLLFPHEDHPLLDYQDDDGYKIEPKYYVPILPMILINGTSGIGTGFSTDVPQYNPLDIIKNIYQLMESKPLIKMIPWYRNFKGTIREMVDSNGYITTGIWKRTNDTTIEITELPIGTWTESYKDYLENLRVNKKPKDPETNNIIIKNINIQNTESDVKFIVKGDKKNLNYLIENGLMDKILKMNTSLNCNNMHLFDEHGNIKKYESADKIITEFYGIRLNYYQKRKDYILKKLKSDLDLLFYKKKYIEYIMTDKELLFKGSEEIINKIKQLKIPTYDKIFGKTNQLENTETPENTTNIIDDNYDYLLKMSAISFSKEMVDKLRKDHQNKEKEYKEMESKHPKDLWRFDLDTFSKNYVKWLSTIDE